jgi:type III secretion protein W
LKRGEENEIRESMADPFSVNLARIEQDSAKIQARQDLARQVLSNARFEEEVEEGFNPAAVEKEQARYNRFRPLENRKRSSESEEKKILEVEQRSEEDLAHDYNRRNPELPEDKLRQVRSNLNQSSTSDEVLEEVNKLFKDPTLADEVLEFLEKGTEGNLNDAVRQARIILNEQKGREIIAGRNVDEAAKAFHKKGIGESPSELRDLYRDITGTPRDHNVLFAELSNKYPFDQLKAVVAFLLKGMGYDLKSKGPSIQQVELMRLMSEIKNLQSILWIYLFFKGRMRLIRSLYAKYSLSFSKKTNFELLAKEFMKLVEDRYPSVLKLLKDAERSGFLDDMEKMIIFTQYRDAIRGLSPRVYRSLKHRQDLLLVILEALEELEEEEEENEETNRNQA